MRMIRWLALIGVPVHAATAQDCLATYPGACVDTSATVSASATVAPGAVVHPFGEVGPGVQLGAGTVGTRATIRGVDDGPLTPSVGDGAVVSARAVVGFDSVVGADAVIARAVVIGDDVLIGEEAWIGYGATIGDRTTVAADSTLGALVEVGDDADVGGIIARSVSIGAGATVDGVIGPDVLVGANATVRGVVRKQAQIGARAIVPASARVGRGATVGDDVELGDSVVLATLASVAGCGTVPPATRVGRGETLTVSDCVQPSEVLPLAAPGATRVLDVEADDAGNRYFLMTTMLSHTVGGTPVTIPNAFDNKQALALVKLDPEGQVLWSVVGDASRQMVPRSMTLHDGVVYAVASYSGNPTIAGSPGTSVGTQSGSVIVAINATTGGVQWTDDILPSTSESSALVASEVVAGPSGVFVAGYVYGSATAGSFDGLTMTGTPQGTDIFFGRLTTDGTWQWVQRAGGDGSEFVQGLTLAANGDPVVAWTYASSTNNTTGVGTLAHGLGPATDTRDVMVSRAAQADGARLAQLRAVSDSGLDVRTLGRDEAGHVYMGGSFSGVPTVGSITLSSPVSARRLYVLQLDGLSLDPQREIRDAGGAGFSDATALHVDGDDVYVAGIVSNDITLANALTTTNARRIFAGRYSLSQQAWIWGRDSTHVPFAEVYDLAIGAGQVHVSGFYTVGPTSLADEVLPIPTGRQDGFLWSFDAAAGP